MSWEENFKIGYTQIIFSRIPSLFNISCYKLSQTSRLSTFGFWKRHKCRPLLKEGNYTRNCWIKERFLELDGHQRIGIQCCSMVKPLCLNGSSHPCPWLPRRIWKGLYWRVFGLDIEKALDFLWYKFIKTIWKTRRSCKLLQSERQHHHVKCRRPLRRILWEKTRLDARNSCVYGSWHSGYSYSSVSKTWCTGWRVQNQWYHSQADANGWEV